MRRVIGWLDYIEGRPFFDTRNSGGPDTGGSYGVRPSGFGVLDPSDVVVYDPQNWDYNQPTRPDWADTAESYVEVKFTPDGGGAVLNLIWEVNEWDYPIMNLGELITQPDSWRIASGNYELRLVVNGQASVNRLFLRTLSPEDSGKHYGDSIWSAEPAGDDSGDEPQFWANFRGTQVLTGDADA